MALPRDAHGRPYSTLRQRHHAPSESPSNVIAPIRRRATATPPITYVAAGETTSPKFAPAFAAGCRGVTAPVAGGLRDGDFAAFCTPSTWPLLAAAQRDGRTWYYGDHAFYRRGRYYRVTMNAYQYQPSLQAIARATPDRFRALHIEMAPTWKKQGTAVVVCPNSSVYMAQHGINAHEWTMDCVRQISQATDRNIIVRWKVQAGRRPIYRDLDDAWAVVTYNSACAVDALLVGVPVFVLCPWATTARMGLSDLSKIESPVYPESRQQFLWELANHQWTLPEIAAGYAWEALHRE